MTRRLFVILLTVGSGLVAQPPLDKSIEAKVTSLLGRMTLEEKVGQMTELSLEAFSLPLKDGEPNRLDPAKLERLIVTYKVGSLINSNVHAHSLDNWHEMLNQIQDEVQKTRLKIPVLYGLDSIHGANYVLGATLFPNAISTAMTWNPALAERAGAISAAQTRAAGVPWNFYPVLDIGRQPLWPRFWETYGEDVHLATTLGLAYIKGMQGADLTADDKVAACLKHYAGYSLPANGRDRTPAILDERTLRQVVLPPFEAAVKAGVPTVMANSGEISGIPGHANKHLLTDILKKEWGFQGFIVSDWEDIKRLHTRDRVADSPKAAVAMAVNAGIDMSMVPLDVSFADLLKEAVKVGLVPMARIDDAVRRILRVKYQVGLFDKPRPNAALKAGFLRKEYDDAALDASREAIVLLKNDSGLLPLSRGGRVLVTGPAANLHSALNGGWSVNWQGDMEQLYRKDPPTVLEAIRQKAPGAKYVPGTDFDKEIDIAAAVRAARDSDVVIAVIGEKAYCETPGNINDLTLDEPQRRLVASLAATGKPVIAVYVGGRPRVLVNIAADAKAFVMGGLPGDWGGRAIAEILYGEVNPSGSLPFSWPKHPNGFTTYDHKPLEKTGDNPVEWQWPFAAGLSYTTFSFSNLKADGGKLSFAVDVKNTGTRPGKVVVPLFLSQSYRTISPPVKELKAFQKVELTPGESRTITFQLTRKDLTFVGIDNKWVLEPGEFKASVAALTVPLKVAR